MNPDLNAFVDYRYKLVFCNDEIRIKGDYEITDYENDVVVLECGGDNICIRGIEMSIIMLNADEICVRGKLSDISFKYREGFE